MAVSFRILLKFFLFEKGALPPKEGGEERGEMSSASYEQALRRRA